MSAWSVPERPDILPGAPLHYAPDNELGVVFLFAHLAKRWRLRIEKIQSGFPDCVAYQKTQSGERRLRIEFEYKSKAFKAHGHNAKGCDWIVCWEHNWLDAPSNLNVIELRREFGLGFNVWVVPVKEPYKKELDETLKARWSVPSQANAGDLVLFYFTHPEMCWPFIYRLAERAARVRAGWKPGNDYMAPIRRVCKVKAPIFLAEMRGHRVLSTAGFVRGQMRARYNVTEHWPFIYDLLVRRNPGLRRTLAAYAPQNL